MAFIFETKNFVVESFEKPHVSRADGGHIKIVSKKNIADRTQFAPKEAIEFMRLTMIIGEAFKVAMESRGIELMRINYQDMGNWAFKSGKEPYFHLHIYGRAKDAKFQPFQEAVYLPDRSSGFYDTFEPLNGEDIEEIKKQINMVMRKDKYNEDNWCL